MYNRGTLAVVRRDMPMAEELSRCKTTAFRVPEVRLSSSEDFYQDRFLGKAGGGDSIILTTL